MKLLGKGTKAGRLRRREDVLGVTGAETIIGSGVSVVGDLIGEDDIHIEGTVHGTIKTSGDIVIGVNGRAKAPVQGFNVSVAGEVEGSIKAEGEVVIRETGRVHGDIIGSGLSIISGGLFNGRSTIKQQHELDLPSNTTED